MAEVPEPKSGRMTLNLAKLIKTLGESLYSDPTVALRELIQNANDSCVHRESLDPDFHESAIHVRFDSYQRTLIVQDAGSGMTWPEAEEFLTVIGNSRTEQVRQYLSSIDRRELADRLIGRFGLGLLSAFIIGDRIEFLTLSHKPDSKPVWWECDGGQDYKMSYSTATPPVGTTVTVHVGARHIGLLNEERLGELIRLFGDLLQVPIYLDPQPDPVNAISAPWDDSEQSTEKDYREFLKRRFPYDEFLEILPLHVVQDGGDFWVKGVLFVPRQPMFIVQEYGDVVLYVRRMLIKRDERELLPPWARFVRGIVDTPSLSEITSRGGVAHDGDFERVQAVLGEAILNHLRTIAVEHPLRFKEVVTAHNVVLKAWSLVASDLFSCVKDLVLFSSDAGRVNLPRYFDASRAQNALVNERGKRLIFYFTTPGGPGAHSILFSARGLHVIDASRFPDEAFLRKYANEHPDVEVRPMDVAGGFVFEEPEDKKPNWGALEHVYEEEPIGAKVVQFQPADIPAVFILPEGQPLTEQVDALLNDPGLSDTIKDLIRRMYEEQEQSHKGKVSGNGVLYLNAASPIIRSLADLDVQDGEIREVMFAVYQNALMLGSHGGKTGLLPGTARAIFEAGNRTISNLMGKILELRKLKEQLRAGPPRDDKSPVREAVSPDAPARPREPRTEHVVCFVAIPFAAEYDVVLDALRDVLEVSPYYWEVARADERAFKRHVSQNVATWIAKAHCYAVEISEVRGNVMMELGHAYWGFPDRPLLILQRTDLKPDLVDLADYIRIDYPWGVSPDRTQIANAFRQKMSAIEDLSNLRRAGMPRFLSTRLMRDSGAAEPVTEKVARIYQTIEAFLAADPQKNADRIGVRHAILSDLQAFIREKVTD